MSAEGVESFPSRVPMSRALEEEMSNCLVARWAVLAVRVVSSFDSVEMKI